MCKTTLNCQHFIYLFFYINMHLWYRSKKFNHFTSKRFFLVFWHLWISVIYCHTKKGLKLVRHPLNWLFVVSNWGKVFIWDVLTSSILYIWVIFQIKIIKNHCVIINPSLVVFNDIIYCIQYNYIYYSHYLGKILFCFFFWFWGEIWIP